jgi:hypothetical protein
MAEQNFEKHAKWVPAVHFFVMPVLLINLGTNLYWLVKLGVVAGQVVPVLVSVALPIGFVSLRMMALKVQDRVIRLEERLRCQRLLPADLQARIGEFTCDQLVALRFASDAELPVLARKVLDEKLVERKAIKQLVKNWRADYLRA